ncbi:MAG: UvrD-helicase domain-containing protein [Candidatus Cryptobacteroides sp.]
MIRIMKASAGSGKTFNLARTYLKLALSKTDRYAYRHILAVTFTNKATEEMKERILKELYVLARRTGESPYLSELLSDFDSVEELRDRASQALSDILHDYSSFSISTIDRFFQHALKAFAREIGQFANYQVELDRESLVFESVDRVLDSLSEENPRLLKWLTGCVMDDLKNGLRYNLEKSLKQIAKSLKSEEHRIMVEQFRIDEEKEYSEENLSRLKSELLKTVEGFKKEVHRRAGALVGKFGEHGLCNDDFKGKRLTGIYANAVPDLKNAPVFPTATVYSFSNDFSVWFKKNDSEKWAYLEDELMPLMRSYCELFTSSFAKEYLTAQEILKDLDELAITMELYREFNLLQQEKNVMTLDDSNVRLRDIIDGSDAPFIYEKLGVRYDNFLLDEFQDTSRIQWNNFLPLLKESNSRGKDCLIVGDVKQSIYRFRGSDWNMLACEVQDTFPDCTVDTLEGNYRSLGNIVRFNNSFFRYAASVFDAKMDESWGQLPFASIYSEKDCVQSVKVNGPSEGCVTAVFCEKEDENARVLGAVRELLDSGARPSDIAILVRSNASGSEIAAYLMDNGLKVISDEFLYLKSSSVVRQTVSLMSATVNEGDEIGAFIAREIGIDTGGISYLSLIDFCEALLRVVRKYDSERFDSQTMYIQSFMDYVQDFASGQGNSPDLFLRFWAETDPKISCPYDPDSVKVMTIHKSKGLEFPHVIIPYVEKMSFSSTEKRWCRPDVAGTSLEDVLTGIYNVTLHIPENERSLFRSDAVREFHHQYMDSINIFYVALTRASRTLSIVARKPGEKPARDSKNFSEVLYGYFEDELPGAEDGENSTDTFRLFRIGDPSGCARTEDDGGSAGEEIDPGYPSIPLNSGPEDRDGDVRERGRLKFSADSIDFFTDEATASRSSRLNGTVMHSILSKVVLRSDLGQAVRQAVLAGDLAQESQDECFRKLNDAISFHPEWFDSVCGRVLSEVPLIDTDGEIYRPDRVIVNGDEVTVIDYKFGEKNPRYRRQVEKYAGIFRRMGYREVRSYIWYVASDTVE